MRHLHLDLGSGAAGDMLLASLVDLGFDLARVQAAVDAAGLHGCRVEARRVSRGGIAATQVLVHEPGEPHEHTHPHDNAHAHPHQHAHMHPHEHGHGHEHPHGHTHAPAHDHAEAHVPAHDHDHGHAHGRVLGDLLDLLARSGIGESVRARAASVFRRLAEAEAAIHGRRVDEVHFHEVSGVDTFVDVVGVCLGLEALGVGSVTASPVAVGSGELVCAHGRLPLPAPATVALLAGAPLRQIDAGAELCTPTGAALLATIVDRFGPMPPLRVDRVGYGAGSRQLPGRPNAVRALVGETDAGAAGEADTVVEIQCTVDDMTGEGAAHATEVLLSAGALDVSAAPVTMKKGRPGLALTVLAAPAQREAVLDALFAHTSTFGARVGLVERACLAREEQSVQVDGRPVRVKLGRRGGRLVRVHAEYEDCRRVAHDTGSTLESVRTRAEQAARRAAEKEENS